MTRPVLIVEDDPDIAEGLRYNLEREGLETRVALTGEKGLQAALDARNPPALVILDLMLPGMSGTELCRRLRREPSTRRTPIIMLTARTRAAGRVATRQQLLDNVWGYEYYGDTRTLDVHIRRLRQKLGPCGDSIETVVGVGYRFTGCSDTKAATSDK